MTGQPTRSPSGRPDFGPGGFLPERAARRARKIVLREQMSAGWPLASLVAGAVLVLAAAVFLLTRTGPPGPPFEPVAEVEAITPRSLARVPAGGSGEVLLVHTGSAVRALEAPAGEVAYCVDSGHLEAPGGSVWDVGGQRVGGTAASLASFPVELHGGAVYVDPTTSLPPPPPAGDEVTPACR